ncbi:RHS repeat-associated core domain-containing protein [Entomospira entomophila]|nr:RHS repeat-associated core domain-containing protein [Entomospira entomophilus]WDI36153.1 RHS repeat-associated core domain-containing protein [Entomospira entomophilus]
MGANARYLDPKTSRWMSSDPAMADGLNWYRYANNNPIKYRDPTGTENLTNEEWRLYFTDRQEAPEFLIRGIQKVHGYLIKWGVDISIGKEIGLAAKVFGVKFEASYSITDNSVSFSMLGTLTIGLDGSIDMQWIDLEPNIEITVGPISITFRPSVALQNLIKKYLEMEFALDQAYRDKTNRMTQEQFAFEREQQVERLQAITKMIEIESELNKEYKEPEKAEE